MKISINPDIKGKPAEGDPIKYLLGCNWQTTEVSWEEAFELITVDGYATCAILKDGLKGEKYFIGRELIMVDIDGGMTIEELLEDPLYNAYGAGYYATAGYTKEHPKFRIMFLAPTPIAVCQTYRHLIAGLVDYYRASDKQCTDATRLFYGCINSQPKEFKKKILPQTVIDAFVENGKNLTPIVQVVAPQRQYTPSDSDKERIVKTLCGMGVIPYKVWTHIGWGLKTGGYSFDDFLLISTATTGETGRRTQKDAEQVWKYDRPAVTMGTVIHILKEKCGDDWWKTSECKERREYNTLTETLNKKWRIK